MTRRAFVTGVGGFTGRHLAELLLNQGWEVHGSVRKVASGVAGVVEHALAVEDWGAVSDAMKSVRPDLVFHLAAVVDTVTTPDLARLYRTNTEGTASVLSAAAASGSVDRVVVASSAFAYGRVPDMLSVIPESTPLRPVTPYGASKAAAETIALQWMRQSRMDVLVTRGFQHTGPGHRGAYALADWARQLATGVQALEVGNLEVVRDYLDVRDAAAALIAVAERGSGGEVYNLASGVPRSMGDMLAMLMQAFGSTARVSHSDTRLRTVDQPRFVADVTKLREATGWSPVHQMEATMAALAASAQEGNS